MRPRKSWEGTALLFFILLTVLLGGAFNLSYAYKFPIPLVPIVIIAVAVSLGVRYWPQRPDGSEPGQHDG